MDKIIERIVEQTKKHNISGVELGKMLGLKKSPLTDWKNRQSNPTLEQTIKICEIFAISIEWLVTGKECGQLTTDEFKIIETYRNTNEQGKRNILAIVEAQCPINEGVSVSKIG